MKVQAITSHGYNHCRGIYCAIKLNLIKKQICLNDKRCVFFCTIQSIMLCLCILVIWWVISISYLLPTADESANKTVTQQIIILISIIILCSFYCVYFFYIGFPWKNDSAFVWPLLCFNEFENISLFFRVTRFNSKNGFIEHMPMKWRMSTIATTTTTTTTSQPCLFESKFGSCISYTARRWTCALQYQRENANLILNPEWSFTPIGHVSINNDCSLLFKYPLVTLFFQYKNRRRNTKQKRSNKFWILKL